jgi:hypothetical protein
MTLVEAIEHIRMSEACDSPEALRQLKNEIGDGMTPIRWADSEGPQDRPDGKRLSTSQLLLIGTGIAPDEHVGYRTLLVGRSAVQRLWPLPSEALPRLPASKEEIREKCRALFAEWAGDPPNLNETWDLLKSELNASRTRLFEVLIEPEFAKRLPAGKHPKRRPK